MSEYQYYEFLATDRPLTSKEQEAVRQISTRAEINSTSFTNEYHWGDFKGDPHKFLEKWYDAHIYLANWGTRRFMFRAPRELVDLPLAKACCNGEAASLEVRGDWAIFDLTLSPDDPGDSDNEDGSGWMATLAPARADFLRGDLRILYLGWLLRAQWGGMEDDDVEPFVPPGLAKLSAPLKGLVDFLGIDSDLLDTAAKKSAATAPESGDGKFAAWLAALPPAEKDELLLGFCEGRDPMTGVRLRRRFEAGRPKVKTERGDRTVRELLDAAARVTEERERAQAERAAAKRAREKRQAEERRAKELDQLAAREPEAWRDVATLVALKTPKGYDQAVALLLDLRDMAVRSDRVAQFDSRTAALRGDHAGKPSFMERLRKVGL